MRLRDRVREFRRIPAGELLPHPSNWRVHSKEQAAVVGGLLEQVGITGVVLVRETRNGFQIIDGHLRCEVLPKDQLVPCLILDVSEKEADYILATHDEIGNLAGTNRAKLDELLAGISVASSPLMGLLESLKSKPLPPPPAMPSVAPDAATPPPAGSAGDLSPPPAPPAKEDRPKPPPDPLADAIYGDGGGPGGGGGDGDFGDDDPDSDIIDIENSGEKYQRNETVRFRGWALPTTPEVAELLNQKILAHYNELGTVMGLGEKFVAAMGQGVGA